MKSKSPSLFVYALCCLLLFCGTFTSQDYTGKKPNTTLTWDVFGYYLYLPSLAYDDLGKLNKLPYILDTYAPTGGPQYQAVKQPNGNYIMKYSSGMAVMYSPAFLVAHCWAKAAGYPVDGMSFPYQAAINFWGIIVAFIGLWFCRKILLRFFDDKIVAITLLVLVLATNYSFYASWCTAFSHNYLFTVYTLIIYFSIKWHEKPSYKTSLALGLLCGLAALTRPTDIICALIPLPWGVTSIIDFKPRLLLLKEQFPKLLLFVIGAVAMGSIQLIYWKIYSGHWLYYSYEDQGFTWLHPHFIDGMFSYKKGWFMYTPVMIFSLIGFVPLYRNHRNIFWPTLIVSGIALYITFAWDIWWYGGSFTQRAVIQYYALLVIPFAAFTESAFKQHRFAIPTTIVFFMCGCLNLFMDWQCDVGIMETNMMNRAYYWRIFGKTSVTLKDRKLLDDPDELPVKLEPLLVLVDTINFDKDSQALVSPFEANTKTIKLDKEHQLRPEPKISVTAKKGWYRVYARVFYQNREWELWRSTQIKLRFYDHGNTIKERSIRIHRITTENSWQEVYADIQIPTDKAVDTMGIISWNADSDKTIYISGYKVYFTPQN